MYSCSFNNKNVNKIINQAILCDRLDYGQGKEDTILLQEKALLPIPFARVFFEQ